jgi:hypothetical protein
MKKYEFGELRYWLYRIEKGLISKKTKIFGLSLALTIILLIVILAVGTYKYNRIMGSLVIPSSETNEPFYQTLDISSTGPNYFFPYVTVSESLTSKYYKAIANFSLSMSVDNSTWIKVPLSNEVKSVEIGIIPANSFTSTIYVKTYFPTQNVIVQNQTIPLIDVINSFHGVITITPYFTPQSWVILILLLVAVFSFILKILEFIFK